MLQSGNQWSNWELQEVWVNVTSKFNLQNTEIHSFCCFQTRSSRSRLFLPRHVPSNPVSNFFSRENVARKASMNLCFQFGEIYERTKPKSVRMYTLSEFGGERFTIRRMGRNSKFMLTYITFSIT